MVHRITKCWTQLKQLSMHACISYFIAVCFIIYYYFIKLKVCDNPLLSKSIGAIFSTVLYFNEGIYMIFF